MFSYRELQTLISGADTEINVDDLVSLRIVIMINTIRLLWSHFIIHIHKLLANIWNLVLIQLG